MSRTDTTTAEPIWRAVATERRRLVTLAHTLSETQWNHPSLCADWRVRDVVAHLVLSANVSIARILPGLIRARGDFDRLIRDTAIRHADRTPTHRLVTELESGIELRITPLGSTPADRLMDLLVHGQDIAIPLGLPHTVPVDAARLALDRLWSTKGPFHAREKFGSHRLVATDTTWSGGSGARVEAPISTLLLLVTGRIPLDDLLEQHPPGTTTPN